MMSAKFRLADNSIIPEIACVYKITNTETQMFYIGSTKNFKQRMREHVVIQHNPRLKNSMIANGIDAFEVEILFVLLDDDRNYLYEVEQSYLDEISDRSTSYNVSRTAFAFDFTDQEFLKRRYDSLKDCRRAVLQYDLDGDLVSRYASLAEAENVGFNHSKVSSACSGKRRSAYGFQWRYEDSLESPVGRYRPNNYKLAVSAHAKDSGEQVRTFKSTYAAGKWILECLGRDTNEKQVLKISKKISMCVKGQRKTAYGYKWVATG